jgi:hypothetical protein
MRSHQIMQLPYSTLIIGEFRRSCLPAIATLCWLLCVSLSTNAQQVGVSTGGQAASNDGQVSFSIGQIDYIATNQVDGSVSQGVQQVYRAQLQVKCFLQGYYRFNSTMTTVLYNQGIEQNVTSTNVDSVFIELHYPYAPYALAYACTGLLQTNGYITCDFPNIVQGNSFYIVLKHRNAIETWSAAPLVLNQHTMLYDFSVASTNAYGNNVTEVESGIWAIYSGDINQDDNIDLIDLSELETDINNFEFGYFTSDINGDGNVDLLDNPVLDSNINNFIYTLRP